MSSKKPNILFIQSDQHSAKVLGHKGHPDVKTPHLDRMAAEGVSFDHALRKALSVHRGEYPGYQGNIVIIMVIMVYQDQSLMVFLRCLVILKQEGIVVLP
jgi:hypothetical protein